MMFSLFWLQPGYDLLYTTHTTLENATQHNPLPLQAYERRHGYHMALLDFYFIQIAQASFLG